MRVEQSHAPTAQVPTQDWLPQARSSQVNSSVSVQQGGIVENAEQESPATVPSGHSTQQLATGPEPAVSPPELSMPPESPEVADTEPALVGSGPSSALAELVVGDLASQLRVPAAEGWQDQAWRTDVGLYPTEGCPAPDAPA